jgi:hypothetical protein
MSLDRPILAADSAREEDLRPWVSSNSNRWWTPKSSTYLSTDCLLPGDVLLFAPVKPDLGQEAIGEFQLRSGSPSEHACFTHAALYLDLDHLICESVPFHGVRYSSLERKLERNHLLVRRWPALEIRHRHAIAITAARLLETPYDWKSPLLAKLKESWGANWNKEAERGLVCSRLCDRSISIALLAEGFEDVSFHSAPGKFVTPAVLSETPKLVDVEIGWRSARLSGGTDV